MKAIQDFNAQKERVTKQFLQNRDKAYADSISGKVWCHTPEMTAFYSKWDKRWDWIQKSFNSIWARISAQYS